MLKIGKNIRRVLIPRLKRKIALFEHEYGITTEEMTKNVDGGILAEVDDIHEWYQAWRLLRELRHN